MKKSFPINNIVFIFIALLAALLMIFKPLEGLADQGHYAMGFTIITVCCWIFKPFGLQNGVSGIFLLGAMMICGQPASVVFSGFSQNALWTLIPALFFGYALQKTGLGQRIAIGLLKVFPSNWIAIIFAWFIIGTVLSLITPSMTVRAVIMIPIALQCCKLYCLAPGSKDSSLFLLTAIFSAIFPGNAFLSGNLTAPIIQGIFDTTPGLEGTINFDTWLSAAFVPIAVITVLTLILGFVFLRPSSKLSREQFLANINKKEKISKNEIITAVILFASCVMFFTTQYHGIPGPAVCIVAAVLLFLSGTLKGEDFTKGVNWDLVFFFGSGLCMSSIFQATGLSTWLSEVLSPIVLNLAENKWLAIILVTLLLFIWRFVDVTTLIPTTVFLAPIVYRMFTDLEMHPAVWGVIFAIVSISMFLTYTNMWTCLGKKMAGEYVWSEGQLFKYGLAFFIASMIGIIVAIPIWMSKGLI